MNSLICFVFDGSFPFSSHFPSLTLGSWMLTSIDCKVKITTCQTWGIWPTDTGCSFCLYLPSTPDACYSRYRWARFAGSLVTHGLIPCYSQNFPVELSFSSYLKNCSADFGVSWVKNFFHKVFFEWLRTINRSSQTYEWLSFLFITAYKLLSRSRGFPFALILTRVTELLFSASCSILPLSLSTSSS